MTPAILHGLVSLFGWSMTELTESEASKAIGDLKALFFEYLLTLIFVIGFIFFTDRQLHFATNGLLYSFFAGIFIFIGNASFFHGTSIGKVSLVSACASGYVVILLLGSLLFFGETLTNLQLLSVGAVLLGSFIISIDISDLIKNHKSHFTDQGAKFGLMALLGYGIGWLLFTEAIRINSLGTPNLISNTMSLTLLTLYFAKKGTLFKYEGFNKKVAAVIMVMGIATIVADISYSIGIEKYQASIIGPIAAATPIVTTLFAKLFFKEAITPDEYIGIILIVLGITGIGVY